MIAPLWYYLLLSAVIFTIGVLGVVIRKNPLVMFMSIELMLNAGGLLFAAFTRYFNVVDGQVFVLLHTHDRRGGGRSWACYHRCDLSIESLHRHRRNQHAQGLITFAV